jgi:lysophospholipase L1-like esterase
MCMRLFAVLGVVAIASLLAAAAGNAAARAVTLVALGDSIPYGQDCGGCTGYVELYGKAASRALGVPVKVDNRAEHNGLDSRRLLAQIRHSARMRAAVRRADIVTLTIGHNNTPWVLSDDPCDGATSDVDGQEDWASYRGSCTQVLADRLAADITGILVEIKRLRAGKPTAIRVTNFHNDHFGEPQGNRAADGPSKEVVDTYSKAICGAAVRAKVPCADFYHAFNGPNGTRFDGPYVSVDHVHPNQRGHALIAALLARFGYAPLAPRS